MTEPTTAETCDCANTGPDAINTCHRVIRGRVEPPCDCDCHKLTREQKCRDLARAMGWDFIPASSEIALPDVGEWYTPLGKIYGDEPPDYFTDHADCHALVVWLATQSEDMQTRFGQLVAQSISFSWEFEGENGTCTLWDYLQDGNLFEYHLVSLLTVEPAVKAEAAWRAITTEPQNLTQLF